MERSLKNSLLVLLLTYAASFQVIGQSSIYKLLDHSEHVQFRDTVIYIPNSEYSQFGHSGPAPLFIQMWYPGVHEAGEHLSFQDFRKRELEGELDSVYVNLCRSMDETSIVYHILESYPDYSPLDYKPYTYHDALQCTKELPTYSVRAQRSIPKDLPVIIYQHGVQGMSDENHVLFEFMASKGFLVISSNYHLPFEGVDYGWNKLVIDELEYNERILDLANAICPKSNKYLIGHSWGAQQSFRFLSKHNEISGFVSLETTLESKTDSAEVKDKWPQLFSLFEKKKPFISTPTLMIGNSEGSADFQFFREANNKTTFMMAPEKDFGHESYTSIFLQRYFCNEEFPQPDSEFMAEQAQRYCNMLYLISSFFNDLEEGNKDFHPSRFKGYKFTIQ